jgi:Ca2+-binding RTX toxin-like protein
VRDSAATNTLEISNSGFAWGQIADMEAWYTQLTAANGALHGQTYSVTGYSLGGHLATVFNQLRQAELQSGPPAATLYQVVTFNGAGVGLVTQGNLTDAVNEFRNLLANPTQIKARLDLTTPELSTFYGTLRTNLANGTWTAAQAKDALNSLSLTNPTETQLAIFAAERAPLTKALNDIITLQTEAARIAPLTAGGTGDDANTSPKAVPSAEILAQTLDYRLAVDLAARNTEAASLIGGAIRGISGKEYGTPQLGNQWDLVGTETTTPVWSAVANSLWHYGTDVPVFIEDQPFVRGSLVSEVVAASLDYGDVKLLIDKYNQNNFADTHSLVLMLDSLSVQNTILNLLPANQRAGATQTLNTILKNASWRKAEINGSQGQAEGDVLENVVNALANLVLGPQIKANRLNGSAEGNTWWGTANQTVGDTTYTGRDRFYAQLKAITDSTIYKDKLANKLTLSPITGSTADLKEKAREDFGAFAALYSLSPFVLRMADGTALDAALQGATPQENPWGAILADWKADKDKVLLGAERGTLNISQEWYDDRAEFLMRKNWFNENNINPDNAAYQIKDDDHVYLKDSAYYKDFSSGYTIQQGVLHDNTHIYAFGDEQANLLAGNGVADHLYGGAGNDSLAGLAGDDLLDGGAGNDTLDGGDGFDRYRVGQGATDRDTIIDGDGKGLIKDANGRIVAGVFVAREGGGYALIGNTDVTATKEGADLVITLQGGAQQVVLANFNNTPGGALGIHLFDTPAAVVGRVGESDILRGAAGAQILHGEAVQTPAQAFALGAAQDGTGARGDILDGGEGDDIALGGAANDLLLGGAGHDLLIGGAGDDALSGDQYLDSEPGSQWTLGVAPDFLRSPDVAVAAVATNVQGADALFGGAGRDLLAGMGGDDYLDGGSGNDILWAGIGNDIAIGGVGSDVIGGADGNDALHGDDSGPLAETSGTNAPGDLIDGGSGDDLLTGSVAKDALFGGDGADTLAGGAGDDLLIGDASISGDVVDTWEVARTPPTDGNSGNYLYTLMGVTGLDDGEGFSGADSLYGGAGADWLLGNGGNDFLDGGSGDDVLFGGADSDTLIGGQGTDVLVGGAGRDTYIFHQGDGEETIIDDNPGGSDANILIFGKGITKEGIKLRKGSLLLDLGDGDAIHIENFDAENPLATQSFASFQFADGSSLTWEEMLAKGFDLDGTDGDDSIEGTGVADRIDGRAGNDLIWGLDGNDVITGGTGTDGLNGGLGDDTYIFNAGDGATLDGTPTGVAETLVDAGGLDTVQFSSTIDPQHLLVRDNLDGSLLIDYHAPDAQPGQPIDRLLIVDGLSGAIERIKVGAGDTARTLDYAQLVGEYGSGVFRGSDTQGRAIVAGGKTDDLIVVTDSNARVSAGQGSDTLRLTGIDATLTVYRGDGVDRLDARAPTPPCASPTRTAADLVVSRVGDDLVVSNAQGDALTIAGWLAGDGLAAGLQPSNSPLRLTQDRLAPSGTATPCAPPCWPARPATIS